MYEPTGTETLVLLRNHRVRDWLPLGEHRIAMDDETLAHLINDPDIEIVDEERTITRPPADVPEELNHG